MEDKILYNRVKELTELFVSSSADQTMIKSLAPDEMLRLIITDSIQAINYIVLLEDEFEVEIDDEDISLSLFETINNVVAVINKQK